MFSRRDATCRVQIVVDATCHVRFIVDATRRVPTVNYTYVI